MPIAIAHQHVLDYEAWRSQFDLYENRRRAYGITNGRVYRNMSDPRDVVLLFDIANESRVRMSCALSLQEAGVETAGVNAVSITILPAWEASLS